MISYATLVTFFVYFVFLMAVGIYFYRRTSNLEDYLLGGRGMGSWVTALSAQASDMSGWLLMGLPGAVYLWGINQSWIAIGLGIGTFFNWLLVAPRLRMYTGKLHSMTLSGFLGERFGDPTGLIRIISALITLLFFTIYASSGLVAAGKLFVAMFGMHYAIAVIVGAVVMILYTFLGGFLAVCWTDLFQGLLMFIAIIVVPIVGLQHAGGMSAIGRSIVEKGLSTSLFTSGSGIAGIVAIISTMAWGLGYFGQPHILARFMGIKSIKELPKSMTIAMIWVVVSLTGAVIVGLIGTAVVPGLSGGNEEKVFILMIDGLFNPWLGGVLLAAILAAIMSTIDSQLLVSSSALTEDFYKHIIRKEASDKELIWVGRICVLIIALIALFLALNPNSTVLGLVSYAWGGFGAAFGPAVLMALFSRKTGWQSILGGIVVGTVVLVIWKNLGLGSVMYEIVPGFLANFLTVFLLNFKFGQQNERILSEFDEVEQSIAKA
ncbi:sodium/proline symporter PutP [Sediminispirochaeta smaragdinae]|uniref:Sodium/proline symporter n=1 Tax=Sediminispirochaeta smaragdinae (strain DSM 11293 / JCM 15392 / SEBR 4228) TaxID=573413 RepID=E1RAQ0_SEDSS|nr:sodium/proline symporter PutP [Sediminispirochaeta smaragdinae]ADK82418.1 sodium/proline symporter [Sediminispirochaeta smaragdinae DSM 11293]